MKSEKIGLVAVCLLVSALLCRPLRGQDAPPGLATERVLPKDTVVLLTMPDVAATGERWSRTALREVFADPETLAMFDPLKRQWQTLSPMLMMALPAPLGQFGKLFGGEVGAGLVLREGPEGVQGAVHVVLGPRDAAAANAAWNAIVGGLKLRQMIKSESTAADGSLRYRLPNGGVLAASVANGVRVLTVSDPEVLDAFHSEAIGRLTSGQDSLGVDAEYRMAMEKIGRPSGARVYANLARIASLASAAGPEAGRFLAGVGLDRARSLAAGGELQDRGIRFSAYLRTPSPAEVFPPRLLTQDDLALIPAGVRSFRIGSVDARAAYDLVVKLVALGNNGDLSEFNEGLQQLETAVGLRIRDEVLALIGERYVTFRPVTEGPAGGGRVLFLKVRDDQLAASAVERVLRGLAQVIGSRFDMPPQSIAQVAKIERDGFTQIYPRSMLPARFTPNFVVGNGWMGVGLSARVVRPAMERMLRRENGALANADFASLLEKMPANYTSIGYTDTPHYAGNVLEWVQLIGDVAHSAARVKLMEQTQGIGNMLLSAGSWLDAGRFPSEALLRDKLFGHVSVTVSDRDGVRYESFSSCGPIPSVGRPSLGMSGPQTAIAAGMLLPALARAREEARKAACMANLAHIGKSLFTYSEDHEDRLPPSLADLVPKYLGNPKTLACPSDGSAPPRIRGDMPCSYCYVGPVPPREASPDLIVACSRANVHAGGRNALHYDGHVKWMSEMDFLVKLAGQARDFWEPLLDKDPEGVNRDRVKAFLAGQFYDEAK